MEVRIYMDCSKCEDQHLIEVDDMVVVDYEARMRECSVLEAATPSIQHEILKWRANWRKEVFIEKIIEMLGEKSFAM